MHLVMTLCEGQVARVFSERRRVSERDIADAVRGVAEALLRSHNNGMMCCATEWQRCIITTLLGLIQRIWYAGIMHRDVKLENILFLHDQAVLVDWNLSLCFAPQTRFHAVTGTRNYWAPEVLLKDYNQTADVWSLGVVTYALLVGALPFPNDGTAHEPATCH